MGAASMPTVNRIAGGIVAIFLNLSRREYRKDEDRLLDSRSRSLGERRNLVRRGSDARGAGQCNGASQTLKREI